LTGSVPHCAQMNRSLQQLLRQRNDVEDQDEEKEEGE
jgi:hypothetical protein